MIRLMGVLFAIISTSLTGTAVIAVLVMGMDTLVPILAAAAVGFLMSIPITWMITKAVSAQ